MKFSIEITQAAYASATTEAIARADRAGHAFYEVHDLLEAHQLDRFSTVYEATYPDGDRLGRELEDALMDVARAHPAALASSVLFSGPMPEPMRPRRSGRFAPGDVLDVLG